jgi:hypothetical protein
MHQMFTGMFVKRSSRHKVSRAFPFTVAWVTHSFLKWLISIYNDEKATGNHSEETVVSISVVLFVISRCICIVFSDDLSLLTLWLAPTLLQTSDQRTLSWKRSTFVVLLIGSWSTSDWKYFAVYFVRWSTSDWKLKYFWSTSERTSKSTFESTSESTSTSSQQYFGFEFFAPRIIWYCSQIIRTLTQNPFHCCTYFHTIRSCSDKL